MAVVCTLKDAPPVMSRRTYVTVACRLSQTALQFPRSYVDQAGRVAVFRWMDGVLRSDGSCVRLLQEHCTVAHCAGDIPSS